LTGTNLNKATVVVISLLAFVALGARGYFLGIRGKQESGLLTPPPEREELDKEQLEKLMVEKSKTQSWVSPDNNFTVLLRAKETPDLYQSETGDGELVVFDDLVFINQATKQEREFELKQLVPESLNDTWKKVPIGHYLYARHLKWSKDGMEFWGSIEIVSGADPAVPSKIALFKVSLKDWGEEVFPIPSENMINWLRPEALNLKKEAILFETTTPDSGELLLYLYEIRSEAKKLIVSYPKRVLVKYFGERYPSLGYYHPQLQGVESRQLEPKWVNENTISYLDFETREEMIRKID
jgi:hypothetical protein